MSRVDTAWLRMDTKADLMMIVGVWLIEPQLAMADLRGCTRSCSWRRADKLLWLAMMLPWER